jgi:ABC-2 type transport system ATP-binding protein
MISVGNLEKKFGDLRAVAGLSFEVYRNEIFGLLGPNGAGKTTTISMICGLSPPTEGSVVFNTDEGKDRKSLIGYCPQENVFYPRLTCREQLLFVGHMYGLPNKTVNNRGNDLLELLGLTGKAHARASSLSGGMKRRLNICLALIHDPEILVLDEPEAGLDPQSRVLVRDFIKALGREKTILLTTHNMDEADRLADRVAIMDHGKLLLLDTPQNLKRTIGEGDVLEMIFENYDQQALDRFTSAIELISMKVKTGHGSVLIRHPDIIGHLPAIKTHAVSAGLTIAEWKLRENTLEDVFIHLTGRKLRQ